MTWFTTRVIFSFGFSCILAQELLPPADSDVGLTEKQMVLRHGYPFESHKVKTEDGYILKLFRIPHGKSSNNTTNKLPVLLLPSLLTSASEWILMGPEKGFGYILADRGYDVWMGNFRGTTWSKNHETLKPEEHPREFWNFSFQEMGYYDLPAFIDYVLKRARTDQIHYIGHSVGTTSFFAMAAVKPEYNKKIKLMVGLSPVCYSGHSTSWLFRSINIYRREIQAVVDAYELYEVLPYSPMLAVLGQVFCNDRSPFQGICASIFYFISGYTSHFNRSTIPVIASTAPAGSSIKSLLHVAQLRATGQFEHFDYGETQNMIKYGEATPPLFDLAKVTAPVALYYSDADPLNAVLDAERAASELPNVVKKRLVRNINHFDFVWASDVVPLIINDVIELMDQFR